MDREALKSNQSTKTVEFEEVKSLVGKTWLEAQDDGDRIIFDTREHGDVGRGRVGGNDVAEARRVAFILKKNFPHHDVDMDAIDEWVVVGIKKKPKSKERILREKNEEKIRNLTAKWKPLVEQALADATVKILGENSQKQNHEQPFHWNKPVLPGKEFGATTFTANYGVRKLYREQQGAIPAFKTPEEGREALKIILASLGGELKAERITPPYAKLTYNYPAPNNVIEEVGSLSFDVKLPLKPPTKVGSLSKPSPSPNLGSKSKGIGK